MTTENDTIQDRVAREGAAKVESTGRVEEGFTDPSATYPKYRNNESSMNRAARGDAINNLDIKTSIPDLEIAIEQDVATTYARSQIYETPSGHVIEYNDTPSGERILIKHNSGAGFDMRPDGTVVINSKKDNFETTDGNKYLAIGADGKVVVYGNLDIDVRGDMNLKVGGNLTSQIGGSVALGVVGSITSRISGSVRSIITGNWQKQILGNEYNLTLGGFTQYVKGNFKSVVHGSSSLFSKNSTRISAQENLDIAANNTNIAARDLTVIGDKGTVGGQNIIMYNYNMHTEKSVWAESMSADTFHGDLNGTAKTAATSVHQSYSDPSTGGGVGTQGTITDTTLDTKATALPTGALMTDFLDNSEAGIAKVEIDPDKGIANQIDLTTTTGNVSRYPLDLGSTRARLRNPDHYSNSEFISYSLSAGNLAANYANSSPSTIGRVIGTTDNTYTGENLIGQVPDDGFRASTFTQTESAGQPRTTTLSVESRFNPSRHSVIVPTTKLSDIVTLGRFLGGYNDPHNINHITDLEEKRQILRNLLIHSQIINLFNNLDSMAGHNLVITEGLYRPQPSETITADSILDLRQSGRCILYELHTNSTGLPSSDKLFDFARLIKNSIFFDELSMRYDTFDPTGKLSVSLAVVVPTIPVSLEATFSMKLSTYFNEVLQSSGALVEMTG
jgi:hypothetical protein